MLARFQNIPDTVQPEDIGIFVRVNHDCAGPMRHDGPGKLRRREHRALHVEMSIDQAWREESALQIDYVPGFVLTEADHAPVIHSHMRPINLTAEDINEIGIFEQ